MNFTHQCTSICLPISLAYNTTEEILGMGKPGTEFWPGMLTAKHEVNKRNEMNINNWYLMGNLVDRQKKYSARASLAQNFGLEC